MSKIYVCMGKDCRKRRLPRSVLQSLQGIGPVKNVGCQKICAPCVIGIDHGDGPRWFKRLKKPKSFDALVAYASGRPAEKPLLKRESAKRAGKLRR
ncbi:MAG: hypothetical protein AAF654_08610 [Myxococcota bacterium]